MRTVNGRIRFPFKDLAIGAVFVFASEEDFGLGYGMERGPWVKISARKYEKVPGSYRPMVCTVGSINVEVIPEEQP